MNDLAPPVSTSKVAAPPVKEKKVKAVKEPKTPKEPKVAGTPGSGVPRPRKFDYGFDLAAKIEVVAGKEDKAPDAVKSGPTVEAFLATGGDKHTLRVLARNGVIAVVHADGKRFPVSL